MGPGGRVAYSTAAAPESAGSGCEDALCGDSSTGPGLRTSGPGVRLGGLLGGRRGAYLDPA